MFERLSDDSVEALARTCAPSLQKLLAAEEEKVQMPLFASMIEREEAEEETLEIEGIVDKVILEALPDRYRKAAEQGYADAQFFLGDMYDNGRGVQKDYAQAVKWYRKAAEQGDAMAQGSLGFMYENGRGVQKDKKEAAKWYRKAGIK